MFAEIDGSARTVVLVEGVSDQRALETLAARRGHDLASAGVAIVAMGGSKNVRYAVDRFGPAGLDLGLAGLVDAPEEGDYRRALERAGLTLGPTRADLERLGFFVCEADLEDELIRALGPARVEAILEAQRRSLDVPHVPAPAGAARSCDRGAAAAVHGHEGRAQGGVRRPPRRGARPRGDAATPRPAAPPRHRELGSTGHAHEPER